MYYSRFAEVVGQNDEKSGYVAAVVGPNIAVEDERR
jgi:hypothetical protein